MAAEQNNEAAFRSFCRLLQDKSTAFSPRRAHETHPQLFTPEQVTTFISDFGTLFSSTFPTEKYNPCAVCGVNARYQCSRCKAFNYCSLACQKQHWTTHRQECGKRTTTVIFNSFRGGDAKECVIVESAGSCSACGKLYDPGERSFDFEFNGGILALSFCSEPCLQKGRTDFSCIRGFRAKPVKRTLRLPSDEEARHRAIFGDHFGFCYIDHVTERPRTHLEFVTFIADLVTKPPRENPHERITELVAYVSENKLFELPGFYSP